MTVEFDESVAALRGLGYQVELLPFAPATHHMTPAMKAEVYRLAVHIISDQPRFVKRCIRRATKMPPVWAASFCFAYGVYLTLMLKETWHQLPFVPPTRLQVAV